MTFVVVILYLVLPTTPTALTGWAGPTYLLLSLGSILILVGVNLWAILVRRRNQLIAVAIIAFATAPFLVGVGILPGGVMVGPFYEHTVGLTFFFFAIALFLLLSGFGSGAQKCHPSSMMCLIVLVRAPASMSLPDKERRVDSDSRVLYQSLARHACMDFHFLAICTFRLGALLSAVADD